MYMVLQPVFFYATVNSNTRLYNSYNMPGRLLSNWYIVTSLYNSLSRWYNYCYSHFTDGEIQVDKINDLREFTQLLNG